MVISPDGADSDSDSDLGSAWWVGSGCIAGGIARVGFSHRRSRKHLAPSVMRYRAELAICRGGDLVAVGPMEQGPKEHQREGVA